MIHCQLRCGEETEFDLVVPRQRRLRPAGRIRSSGMPGLWRQAGSARPYGARSEQRRAQTGGGCARARAEAGAAQPGGGSGRADARSHAGHAPAPAIRGREKL